MKKKLLTLAMALLLSVSMFTAGALAASGNRTIEVTYRDIKLVVDGAEVTLKDGAGNSIEPFIYNGSTYVPLRAVGEALNKGVDWDESTNTVYIGTKISPIPYQVNNATLYDGSDTSKYFSVAGQNYTTGVVLSSYRSKSTGSAYWFDGSAVWNTEGCSTMTFTVGHVGSKQYNTTLYVSLDGVAAGEYELRWDGSPQTITVPLGGSPNVKLTLQAQSEDKSASISNGTETYGIYNISIS